MRTDKNTNIADSKGTLDDMNYIIDSIKDYYDEPLIDEKEIYRHMNNSNVISLDRGRVK